MKPLLSIAEAARQAGISRRTIERALAAQQLVWHGRTRRGRYAKGLRLADVLKVCATADRQARRSVVQAVASGFAEGPEGERGRIQALAMLVQAATVGAADADLLASAIQLLRDGDQTFVLALLGRPVSKNVLGAGRRWLADEIRTLAGGAVSPALAGLRFDELWRMLAREWVRAPLDAEMALVYDRTSGTAEVHLCPRWLSRAPAGLDLPELGGKVSVAERKRHAGRTEANRAATKIMRAVDTRGGLADADGDLTHAYQSLIQLGPAGSYLRMVELDPSMQGNSVPTARKLLRDLFGLSMPEAQALLIAHRRLSGEVLDTRTIGVPADDRSGVCASDGEASVAGCRRTVSYDTAAQVFGTTRQTFAKWVWRAMREAADRRRT